MPFGLPHVPATFQAYIDDCKRANICDFAICYLDNMLIYSTNENEHDNHAKPVFEQLHQCGLYCKAKKCQFRDSKIDFFRCIISSDVIGMESDRVSTIED